MRSEQQIAAVERGGLVVQITIYPRADYSREDACIISLEGTLLFFLSLPHLYRDKSSINVRHLAISRFHTIKSYLGELIYTEEECKKWRAQLRQHDA